MIEKRKVVPLPTLKRYSQYLDILKQLMQQKKKYVSSAFIAQELGFESIQVRKDLFYCDVTGQPRVGFELSMLIKKMYKVLGWSDLTNAFLAGAGNLGHALGGYSRFSDYGLQITAFFDNDPLLIGEIIKGKKIFPIEKIPDLAKQFQVKIGIITVPPESAQEIADLMVASGITALWNFTNKNIKVPLHVIVEKVDLAASLAVLYNKLRQREFCSNE